MILQYLTPEELLQKIEEIVVRAVASKSAPNPTQSENLISEKEAAPKIGMSKSNLARKRKAGLISYVKSGERIFYKQKHLDDYLREIKLRGTKF